MQLEYVRTFLEYVRTFINKLCYSSLQYKLTILIIYFYKSASLGLHQYFQKLKYTEHGTGRNKKTNKIIHLFCKNDLESIRLIMVLTAI